ncbi:MAG: dihydrolipoamide acetyltransferase family protein [Candidatus Binatia bacterium]
MPKFGLTMQEGTIQQWFKAEGDTVRKGEPLFEVETEKVLYEVEAPASGQLAKLLYAAEATVPCAAVVAIIAVEGEDPSRVAAAYAADRRETAAPRPPDLSVPHAGAATTRATPAARKLAKEHGVDLAVIRGSGPSGRITREDVEAVLAHQRARPTDGEPPVLATAQALPVRGARKLIAERLLKSLHSTAQLTLTSEADVSALVARRRRLASQFPLTYTDLLVEAVAKALRDHPRLNVTVAGGTVQQHAAVDVGVAVAIDDGLVVPVIRAADRKPLQRIAEESRLLADKARAGTLTVDDVSGGTFTITNLGMYGVDAFTPILHLPQIAILGVGRIAEKPAVHDHAVVPRWMVVLSLTIDHRIVDGAPAAAFLGTVVDYLQSHSERGRGLATG